MLAEMRDPNATCRASSCAARLHDRGACTGSGAYRSRNQSSDRNVPSPSTDSRKEAIANSGSSTSVLSEACPPAVDSPSSVALEQRPPGEHFDVAGLVGRLDREHLHHFAEVRVQLRDEPARHDQRGGFVLDEVSHDLDDRVFDFVGEIERRIPRDRGRGIPLRGDGLLIDARRVVGPDLDLVGEREVELGRAGFDQRAARGEPPRRGGCSATVSASRRPSRRRRAARRPSARPRRAPSE